MLKKMPLLHRFLRSPWVFRSLWLLAASFLLMMAGLLAYGAYLATFLELQNLKRPSLTQGGSYKRGILNYYEN